VRTEAQLRTTVPESRDPIRPDRAARRAVAATAVLVAVTAAWGLWLNSRGSGIALGAAPLAGAYRLGVTPLVVLPIALGGAISWWGFPVARRAPWGSLVAASFLAAAAWAVVLALVEGPGGLTEGVTNRWEYLADLDRVGVPSEFLATFTDRIDGYVTHVRAHPPGLLLVLWGLDRIGLAGPGWPAALMIAGGAAAVPAALVAARDIAGERAARAAAPFLVLAPAAIWVATSADALFAGVGAWGVTLLILATGRRDIRGDLLAAGGGVTLGAGLFLSYGLVPLGVIPLAVAIARRRIRPLMLAAAAILLVGLAFAALGFWWPEGLRETTREYYEGIAGHRPYAYFVVANVAAFAVTVGPATVAGLALLRERRLWLLVGAALLAVAAADVSGLSRGEVERIWLPFVVWAGLASAAVTTSRRPRAWAVAQVATATAVQVGVATIW
jgi:hypothetical protein